MKTPPILSIHLSSGRGHRLLLQTCLLPAAILLPAALNADDEVAEAPVAEKSSVFELGEIVVKGVAESDIASLNTTMSAEDISIVSAKNVGRALSSLPGVTLTRFGPRNEEAVYVRGFDRTNVPIYVDGVPVCVPYDGFADLARFTTMDISSITLSKGYSSVLSGPNAFGGVINIVSAKPVNAFESSASLGVYSGGGLRSDVSAGTRQDKWFATLAASTDEMDYFTLPKDFVPTTYEDGDQRDNSYEKDWKVSGKVGYTPNATDEYVIGFSHQDGEKGTPVYAGTIATTAVKFWQWPQWNKSTVYYTSITHFGESYIHPRFYYDQYDNTLNAFDDATYTTMAKKSSFTSIYEDYSYGGSLEGGTDELDKVTLKAAAHYKLDHHNEHNVGYAHYEFEDSIWSSGVEATTKFDSPWKAQLGVGYDTISTGKAVDSNTGLAVEGKEFDSINPAAVLFYDLGDAGALHLSVARKSRFPTIKDRYSYKMGTAIPNPELKPESVMHYEFGYAGSPFKTLHVSSAVFLSRIDDTIESVANAATNSSGKWVSQNRNVGESENEGFELALRWTPTGNLALGGNYTWLFRKNISSPALKPTYTPKHSGMLYAEYAPVKWLSLVPNFDLAGKRYTDTSGAEVDAFIVTNFKVVVSYGESWSFDAGVRNLFDCLYAYQEGFPEAGRSFFCNLRYQY